MSSSLPTTTGTATAGETASATDAGSPGISGHSAPGGGASGTAGSGSGSGSGSMTAVTYTNSAGATMATTFAVGNGTVAPTVGSPTAPTTAAGGISTGAAVANVGSVAGVFGAALAVVAAL